GPLDLLRDLRRDPVASPDEAQAHAVRVHLLRLAADALEEQAHQPRHLLEGSRPVLGRERVDRELLDAEVGGQLYGALERVGAGAVALRDAQAPGLGPAGVSVHDDRHVTGAIAAHNRPFAAAVHRTLPPLL